jgi:hypothetical protein
VKFYDDLKLPDAFVSENKATLAGILDSTTMDPMLNLPLEHKESSFLRSRSPMSQRAQPLHRLADCCRDHLPFGACSWDSFV